MSKFESAISHCPEIQSQINDYEFAHSLYGALCNSEFVNIYTLEKTGMTWRAAADFVENLRKGDDLFYCSGGEGSCPVSLDLLFLRLGWERNSL
jgi:hypothetical protein